MKEMISLGMVNTVDWVPTDRQLADCMTKRGLNKKADWLLSVAKRNKLHEDLSDLDQQDILVA